MCHKAIGKTGIVRLTPEAQEALKDKIYRPGEDLPKMTEIERSDLRKDLEQILHEHHEAKKK